MFIVYKGSILTLQTNHEWGDFLLAIIMVIENDDERHFVEQVYENYKHAMFRVARAVLHDDDKADDAVSAAFVKIIAHVGEYKSIPCNKIKALVVIVVRNISINMLRRDKLIQFVSLPDELPDPDGDTDTVVTRNYDYKNILTAISKLDEKYLAVMGLKYLEGYSDIEIAGLLDISNENVRVRLHRGRQQLNRILEENKDG